MYDFVSKLFQCQITIVNLTASEAPAPYPALQQTHPSTYSVSICEYKPQTSNTFNEQGSKVIV